jgi:hypothetical protein
MLRQLLARILLSLVIIMATPHVIHASTSEQGPFNQELKAVYERCPRPFVRGTAEAAIRCRVNGQRDVWLTYAPHAVGLFDAWGVIVLRLGRDYDAGKITADQYHVAWAKAAIDTDAIIKAIHAPPVSAPEQPEAPDAQDKKCLG